MEETGENHRKITGTSGKTHRFFGGKGSELHFLQVFDIRLVSLQCQEEFRSTEVGDRRKLMFFVGFYALKRNMISLDL